uniref:Uncharacterized protein n=1 Tax=Lates calcarifer TaxID=8187 RepID=A0A4W6DHX9_LATCA
IAKIVRRGLGSPKVQLHLCGLFVGSSAYRSSHQAHDPDHRKTNPLTTCWLLFVSGPEPLFILWMDESQTQDFLVIRLVWEALRTIGCVCSSRARYSAP